MNMRWKIKIKRAIPKELLNSLLLTFPFLYRTRLVQYETTLQEGHGIDDLLEKLKTTESCPGDVIECGSSRCGASVIIANALRSRGLKKKIYACDTFESFDPKELERERRQGLVNVPDGAFTSTSYEYVKKKIDRLGVSDMVFPVKGLFKDTLPSLREKVCFALIDCDLRDSLVYSAEMIWPNLSSGGSLVFDDYLSEDWKGARIGTDFIVNKFKDQISAHGVMRRLYYIDKR